MPDRTDELLPALRSGRLPGLDLGPGLVYPAYDGRSILNLPATFCRLLGVQELGAPPLADELLAALGGGARRIVLAVVDALALHRLRRWMSDGTAPVWSRLAGEGLLAPLTSVVPSTTSAALTSLWTGQPTAVHGLTGYEMWMKEYGVVANTILQSPITFYKGEVGSLEHAGFSPEEYLPVPTLGTHLAVQGIPAFVFQHHNLVHSGLARMYFKDVTVSGVMTPVDLWINVRRLLEERAGEKLFIWAYWGEVDSFGHYYGPEDERTAAEFAAYSTAFERLFLERLSLEARRDTLLILVADHGQIVTPPDPYYELRNHPGLTRRLHILPTGEHRLAYLYVRPGQMEAVREYLERTWPNGFSILDPGYAVESGLFGPGPPHPRLADRLGDYIVLARGGAYLWWGANENHMLGRHGGLHPDEMLVPFLAVRL